MDAHVLETVEAVVKRELSDVEIVAVKVSEDVDHDDIPVLRIEIIFNSPSDRLNPKQVVGLARHLRDPLAALKVLGAPLFRFKTGSEHLGEAA